VSQWRDAFAATVRGDRVGLGDACALLAAELGRVHGLVVPDDPVASGRQALDALATGVPAGGPAHERLRVALGGFGGDADDYDDLRASLIHEVVRRRRGLPILLSAVWLEVAARAGIPAYGLGLPGHFVVGLGDPDGYHVVVDPFAGGLTMRPAEVTSLVARASGAAPGPSALRPWEPVEILQRVLLNVSAWAATPARWQVRRAALELALLLPRHSLDLRRRHGELMVTMGGYLEGAVQLEAYSDAVEPVDPAAAQRARRSARQARSRLN